MSDQNNQNLEKLFSDIIFYDENSLIHTQSENKITNKYELNNLLNYPTLEPTYEPSLTLITVTPTRKPTFNPTFNVTEQPIQKNNFRPFLNKNDKLIIYVVVPFFFVFLTLSGLFMYRKIFIKDQMSNKNDSDEDFLRENTFSNDIVIYDDNTTLGFDIGLTSDDQSAVCSEEINLNFDNQIINDNEINV